MTIKLIDIAWAAGFLEGEGSFSYAKTTPRVEAPQNQVEPLLRLQKLFGGAIYKSSPTAKNNKISTWSICGKPAAGVMMALWVLMSPWRKVQIEYALSEWKKQAPRLGSKKGYVWDRDKLCWRKKDA